METRALPVRRDTNMLYHLLAYQRKIEIPEDVADHLLHVCAQALQQRGKCALTVLVVRLQKNSQELTLGANMGHGETQTIRPILACPATDTLHPTIICTHRPAKEQHTNPLVIDFILFDIVNTFQSIQVSVYGYNVFIPQSHPAGFELPQQPGDCPCRHLCDEAKSP